MVKEKAGIPGKINEFGEKEYVFYTTDYHRTMAYQKVDGSGRVAVEEHTKNGWSVIVEEEKTAQEMTKLYVRECVQCGTDKIAKTIC